MADEDRDERVASAYGELRRPEPPPALDDAILAASRRAVGSRPGGADGGRRGSSTARWAVPVSVAAVLALSVLVTLHIEDERPDLALPPPVVAERPPKARAPATPAPEATSSAKESVAAPEVAATPAPAAPGARADAAPREQPSRGPVAARDAAADREPPRPAVVFAPDPAPTKGVGAVPATPPPAPAASVELSAQAPVASSAGAAGASAPAPAAAPAAEVRQRGELARERDSARRAREERNVADAVAKKPGEVDTPERELERIAALRREGRHAEADRLLAEFRVRHPDYRIPEATLEKVQPPR